MPDQQHTDRARPGEGKTVTAQGENPKARTPHEHDESADSQSSESPSIRRMGEIGHDDLAAGQVDTDKGPAMDATYVKVKKGDKKKP